MNAPNVKKAEKFARHIPQHLKTDAMLLNVVDQLAEGAVFRPASSAYIARYMRTATKPMSQQEYAEALAKALSRS